MQKPQLAPGLCFTQGHPLLVFAVASLCRGQKTCNRRTGGWATRRRHRFLSSNAHVAHQQVQIHPWRQRKVLSGWTELFDCETGEAKSRNVT